ncbi:ATP-dependent zinc protease [Vibrio sp. FNV 38]|nr:ATP-dependent zinc protease [Vibrio sp. FNV 38]
MNKSRQLLIILMVTGGLVACSATPPPIEREPETPEIEIEQPIERPDIEQPIEPEIEQPVEPAVKPEPKPEPEPKPLAVKTDDGKLILGSKEWVYFPGLSQNVKARIDTGATTSSISAVEIVPFERDGKDWVTFKIEHDGVKTKELKTPVQRWVKVKQSNSDDTQRRPVVSGWIQIGDLKEQTEFTLTDRSHMDHPVLLGRSFFNDIAVIDVSRSFVQGKSTPTP